MQNTLRSFPGELADPRCFLSMVNASCGDRVRSIREVVLTVS